MYDVRTESWLPVVDPSGAVREVGIVEALSRAHELRGLATSTPLEHVAILRMLVAIVHRALNGPRTLDEGRALYEAGRIPDEVPGYVQSDAGEWDLFHPERPWLQAPSVAEDGTGPSQPARLFLWQRNNPVFWQHIHDLAPRPSSPAEAARGLLLTHAYALAGGVSKPFNFKDGTIARALVCVVEGNSLADSILLNAVRYADDEPMPRSDDDSPAWERVERLPQKGGTILDGYVDFLTLTTRRVLLELDDDGLVRRCRYAQGLTPQEVGTRDPFTPYRRTENGLIPMRPNPSRALWRDLPAIAAGLAPEVRKSQSVLHWAARLTDGAQLRLRVVGIVLNQAKIDMIVHGELRVPAAIADSPDHRLALESALALADQAERAVTAGLRTAAAELVAADKDSRSVARRLLGFASFWPHLEVPFSGLVSAVADLDVDRVSEPGAEPLAAWTETVRREAGRAYEDGVRPLGDAGRALMAAARGRDRLEASLRKHLPQTAPHEAVA